MARKINLNFLSIVIFFLISFIGCEKKEEKAKTFGGSYIDIVSSLQQTSDDGFILAGLTYSFGAGLSDAFILKLDLNGNLQWQKTYGGRRSDTANSIQQTTDGGFIVAGSTFSFGNGLSDVWILKLDKDGSLIWQKTYGGSDSDIANSIQQTTDGGFIVAGSTFSFGNGLSDVWILKLDKDGSLIWQKTYGGSDSDIANSIQQTTDGGFIVAGSTFSFGNGLSDVWILKLDKDGGLIWQKTYGDPYRDEAYSIGLTSDGGYIIAGHTALSLNDINLWVFKIDSSGKMLWQKKLGNENIDEAYSAKQTSDGGYIVVGYATPSRTSFSDIWVLKLSPTGMTEWEKIFGGARRDVAASVIETFDGSYIIACSTTSYGAGNYDIWVLKLDSKGGFIW